MDVLQCSRCAAAYTPERELAWGRTKGSDGYGPNARCTELVPSLYAPKTPQGETPLQVCGGQLIAKTEEQALATVQARALSAGDGARAAVAALTIIAEEPITVRR